MLATSQFWEKDLSFVNCPDEFIKDLVIEQSASRPKSGRPRADLRLIRFKLPAFTSAALTPCLFEATVPN